MKHNVACLVCFEVVLESLGHNYGRIIFPVPREVWRCPRVPENQIVEIARTAQSLQQSARSMVRSLSMKAMGMPAVGENVWLPYR